ncbi:hypothetical protein [Prochlorococcus marinus]|uniref:Uncharacterized protein n=1 Tax=Prochlorococcus marinus XMU1408 TaxID=2213228 RepID=A0A318R2K2_PROMR|nr:hypothetical protein [Prochlorococcus marinus]MBW3042395.1 hypothetical protein [Prochlorococcus marinus str. XMU1408]PYE01130.1 hypothetical protein DNJ73_06790 [Prochlorococcus marinus XMU1408]
MIPFIRSLTELTAITKSRDNIHKIAIREELNTLAEDSGQRKRYIRSENEEKIILPDLPKTSRHKWMNTKKSVSKFFNDLDYNNQIQSSYNLTLLERQQNYDNKDVA